MSSIAEIRHHIKVVRDTSKITRAMYLISSAKMKKAMRMHDQNQLYFLRVRSDIRFIMDNIGESISNPYYRQHGKKTGYVVIAGDKGLCGGYNSEVLKLARRTIQDGVHEERYLFTLGHMASDYFMRLNMNPDVDFLHVMQDPSLQNARQITSTLCKLFREKELDEVYIIYTVLQKMGQLKPTVLRLLPVLREDFGDAPILHAPTGPLMFHPSAAEVLDTMVPHYLVGLVYSALVQSYASEQSARMSAMDAATRNADEMLGRLNLEFNHARQAIITQEISEIISGNPDQGAIS
jgi:F-type H+-transporting ATPase subunit gamma